VSPRYGKEKLKKPTRKEQTIKYYEERIRYINFQINEELTKKRKCELKIQDLKRHKRDLIGRMKDVQKELI
jgi:hypothetical protein